MLFVAESIKLVTEIALMALAGQFVLGLLAGARRDENLFYRLFQVLTGPFTKGVRAITPRIVLDRHIPVATFLLLAMVWVVATATRIGICLQIGIERCR